MQKKKQTKNDNGIKILNKNKLKKYKKNINKKN